jgi:hypothetical protein
MIDFMKAVFMALAVAMNSTPFVFAEEGHSLLLRSKAAIETAAPHRSAPYVQPLGEPERAPLFAPRDVRQEQSRSSCASQRALCYDQESGHIVYKPARRLLPDIPGLSPDGISLKRDKIVLKYTF